MFRKYHKGCITLYLAAEIQVSLVKLLGVWGGEIFGTKQMRYIEVLLPSFIFGFLDPSRSGSHVANNIAQLGRVLRREGMAGVRGLRAIINLILKH